MVIISKFDGKNFMFQSMQIKQLDTCCCMILYQIDQRHD